jgi:hypothetical protein
MMAIASAIVPRSRGFARAFVTCPPVVFDADDDHAVADAAGEAVGDQDAHRFVGKGAAAEPPLLAVAHQRLLGESGEADALKVSVCATAPRSSLVNCQV